MIMVYSKDNCQACRQTKNLLGGLGLEFKETNVQEDPIALQKIIELGYSSVPVIVSDQEHWSGFQPDKLKTLC